MKDLEKFIRIDNVRHSDSEDHCTVWLPISDIKRVYIAPIDIWIGRKKFHTKMTIDTKAGLSYDILDKSRIDFIMNYLNVQSINGEEL